MRTAELFRWPQKVLGGSSEMRTARLKILHSPHQDGTSKAPQRPIWIRPRFFLLFDKDVAHGSKSTRRADKNRKKTGGSF